MARKLSMLAVTLALVVLIARTTSAFRTTFTTVEVEDNTGSSEQCRQQLQDHNLNNCQELVRQQGRGYLALSTDDSNQQQQQYERQCCRELSEIPEQCQCQALEELLLLQVLEGHLSVEQTERVALQFEDLPQRCQSGSQRCQFHGSSRRLTF
ncbi:hypothetical protein FNV43_RR03960 [Rhamnella rubrinervis]|uniref:Bifunctional inhibitor/plant lipid transfer protein/seed storage helical domain-containing protein n=1 Tax=Rhamnella rubrinervis TaxID=2594499 RepID=A0A8K0HJF6_9ROSA|nr:hypothetical protein FNV43_RR03960 [Rhamnella rubrinervis]